MNFLLDENLPASAVAWFERRGHAAMHVESLGRSVRDRLIADAASGAVIVTRDKDFAGLLHLTRQVVLIRDRNAVKSRLIALWEARWPDIEAALSRGDALVVVSAAPNG